MCNFFDVVSDWCIAALIKMFLTQIVSNSKKMCFDSEGNFVIDSESGRGRTRKPPCKFCWISTSPLFTEASFLWIFMQTISTPCEFWNPRLLWVCGDGLRPAAMPGLGRPGAADCAAWGGRPARGGGWERSGLCPRWAWFRRGAYSFPPSSADTMSGDCLPSLLLSELSESPASLPFLTRVGQSAIRWPSLLQWWHRFGCGPIEHLAAMWFANSPQL